MRSVGEHLNLCLLSAVPLSALAVPLDDAVDCVLAADVVADSDLPDADLAGVDGYAVSRDSVVNLPVVLPVTAELLAGDSSWTRLVPGGAIKVASGAILPPGADMVVPLSSTDMGIVQVKIGSLGGESDAGSRGSCHIIPRGADVSSGQVVLKKGQRLDAKKIALLSALGMSLVLVHPKVRVVIVAVGDELVEPGMPRESGQVNDANGHSLSAACQECGAKTFKVRASDERRLLRETIEDQLVRADVIVTTGGLSYGPEDTVKEVLSSLGDMRFDNVAIAPGRQLGVGHIGEVPVFCLPGSPLSAQVAFETFIRPVLRKMSGRKRLYRDSVLASVDRGWDSPVGKREFVPVVLTGGEGQYQAQVLGSHPQARLRALAGANAFAVVPENMSRVDAGQSLHCMVLD